MPDRRTFLAAAGAAAASVSLAQQKPAQRTYRIGLLRPTARPPEPDPINVEALLPALLRERGLDPRGIVIEPRYAEGDLNRLPALARELVALKVDVIVAVAAASVRAAMAATKTIPIVLWGNFDPVAQGFVTSLSRPGGNVTGVLIAPDGTLGGKKLELLKQAVPAARRIAVLAPEDPNSLREQMPELQRVAPSLNVDLVVVTVRNRSYAQAFAAVAAERVAAVFMAATTYFVLDRKPLIELATRYRLPTMWEWREQAEEGGLMAYGASLTARIGQVAEHVDRILRGSRPADVPIDRPLQQELTINLRTARAIGLAVPRELALLANHLID